MSFFNERHEKLQPKMAINNSQKHSTMNTTENSFNNMLIKKYVLV